MKKLFTLLVFAFFLVAFSLAAFAQDKPETPVIDSITTNFRVVDLEGETAKIMTSRGGRFYQVSANPELNPFGYILEAEREFTICIEVDKNLIFRKQTRGQTGIVPARIIWFTVSPPQLQRDMLMLKRFIEEEPGYDRSPRY